MSLKLFRKKAYVGVDLGTQSIKVCQIEPSGNRWAVTKHGEAKTPSDSIKDGVVVDTMAVADALKHALKVARISGTSAIIGVAGGSVIVRNVRIPRMPEATLRKCFAGARRAREILSAAGHPATELSMGMSGDYEIAVEEGATLVRLGTILFGART